MKPLIQYFHHARGFHFCFVLLLIHSVELNAASWNVEPVRVELTSEQTTSAITIRNDGDQVTSIQVQIVAWSQVDGKDVYTPTKELLHL